MCFIFILFQWTLIEDQKQIAHGLGPCDRDTPAGAIHADNSLSPFKT